MDCYEKEKERVEKEVQEELQRVKKDLQGEFKKVIKSGYSFQGIKKALVDYVVEEIIGAEREDNTFTVEKSYQALLKKLDKEGINVLEQYIDAREEQECMIFNAHIRDTINFMLKHLFTIANEMDKVFQKEEKESRKEG